MIASVNLDVSIVNVTNESVAGRRRKGRVRGETARRTGIKGEQGREVWPKGKEDGKRVRRKRLYMSLVLDLSMLWDAGVYKYE